MLLQLVYFHVPGGSESALQKPKQDVRRGILSGTTKPNMPLAVPEISYLHHRLLTVLRLVAASSQESLEVLRAFLAVSNQSGSEKCVANPGDASSR
ncbi:MAG: hypothetical protein ABSC64_10225 [Candidatus Korobacteraceae bacterium]|jgi:hypothetical protein